MADGTLLKIILSEPATDELVGRIEGIPSVLEVVSSRSPLAGHLTALLEQGAEVDETAYLIESLPGVRSVEE